jgi:nicotinamide/nicotinate riboside kinase
LKDLTPKIGKNNNTFDKTITAEMDRLATEIKSKTSAKIFCVDGFLLYTKKTVIELLDIKFFLKSGFDTLKARRNQRDAYITLAGTWKDPPLYFENVVYPNYLKYNHNVQDICDVIDTEDGIEKMVIQALKVILRSVSETTARYVEDLV